MSSSNDGNTLPPSSQARASFSAVAQLQSSSSSPVPMAVDPTNSASSPMDVDGHEPPSSSVVTKQLFPSQSSTTNKKKNKQTDNTNTPHGGEKKTKKFQQQQTFQQQLSRRSRPSRKKKKGDSNKSNQQNQPSSPHPKSLPSPTASNASPSPRNCSPRHITFTTGNKKSSTSDTNINSNNNNNNDAQNTNTNNIGNKKNGNSNNKSNTNNNDTTTKNKKKKVDTLPPNKFIEAPFRPQTFNKNISAEEVYDDQDISAHDKEFWSAIKNQFDSQKASSSGKDKPSVKQGLLSNDRRCLSRLHVEDMLHQHAAEGDNNRVHFRVLLAKDNKDKRWKDKTLVFNAQRRMQNNGTELGVEKSTIMKKEYLELYATLVPNDTHKAIKDGQLAKGELFERYNNGGGFELDFFGMSGRNRMKFEWKDMVDNAEDVMFFGEKHKTTRHYDRLFKDRETVTYQHHVFRQFALETRGDPLAASSLFSAYYMKQSIIGSDDLNKQNKKKLDDICDEMTFLGKKQSAFFAKVDREFETAVKDSLSEFQDYGLALITLETLEKFMEEASELFPGIWKALCKMRNINPTFSRGKDLVLSKQLQVFFQLLSSARQADDRRLIYWSLVHSLASYGWGVANKAQKFSCYWGNTCHPVTRDRKMKELTKDLIAKQMKLLSGETAVIIVYDNYQRGQHLKYQREGSSSGYVKGTHQLANKVRLWKGTEYDTKFVEMDYVNQAIPSLPGLPAFENVNITSPLAVSEQLVFSNMMEPEYVVDFTGKRVESYLKLGVIADTVVQMWRSFTPENVYPGSGVFDDGRIESLHKLVTSKSVKDLFDGAKHFRDSVTKCWNPSVGEVTMQLMLGLCGLAEESAKQCGAITLDQLFRVGVLVENEDGTWKLAPNWKDRRVYLFGDCKTIENNAKFYRDLGNLPLSFDESSLLADTFMDAMSVVMQLPGDWHAGLAMLQAIYTLFYRGFLEPFQKALGWKNINIQVSGCYFQACRLAGIVADELVRVLMYQFGSKFAEVAEGENREEYICRFAMEFATFVNDMQESDDEWRRGCALYLIMYTEFRAFVDSYRRGDSFSTLDGYANFAPRWQELGQFKYVERYLDQLDTLLRDFMYSWYAESMLNRCVRRFHEDTGKRMLAQDEALELKNASFAQFPPVMKTESFIRQGNFVGPSERAKRTVSQYFSIKKSGNDEQEVYEGSVKPSEKPELALVFEMFMLLDTASENSERKFTNELVFDVVGNAKTKVTLKRDNTSTGKNNASLDAAYTRLYSSINQILPPSSNSVNENGDDTTAEDEEETTLDETLDEDDLMRQVRANIDVQTPVGDQSSKDKKGYHNLHKMMLVDVKKKGIEKFKTMNIAAVREAAKERKKRTRLVGQEILHHVTKEQKEKEYGKVGVEEDGLPPLPWRQFAADIRRDSDLTDVFVSHRSE